MHDLKGALAHKKANAIDINIIVSKPDDKQTDLAPPGKPDPMSAQAPGLAPEPMEHSDPEGDAEMMAALMKHANPDDVASNRKPKSLGDRAQLAHMKKAK